ncbi:tyrosine-protein phosphatase Lar isoform X4 [Ischnura elegans]|uniref:tyrosine-protein phosphatase Lar isoform X4 n=1 Tax=Ischnura elegans TaxID=197161 RepID=UPI001ED8A7EA|nr:tyrosine-protein phosphatase Lar isoform X4 [Ischnura elegans]
MRFSAMSLRGVLFLLALTVAASKGLGKRDPPEITVRPRDQQVRGGGIASFVCAAEGDPAPQLQWRKNGKKISSTQSRYLVQEIPPPPPSANSQTSIPGAAIGNRGGKAALLLRIEPVRPGRDDASYECVAENGVGDAVSAEAMLTVYDNEKLPAGFPRIVQAPTTKVVEIGHTAVLLCEASGTPPPKLHWLRDMVPLYIRAQPRYHTLEQGALQISNSEEEDQGKYECVAENVVGTEYSHSTMLYVKVRRVPPQFSIPPRPVEEVTVGGDVNLTCVAVGSPMPYVKWREGESIELTPEDQLPIGRNVLRLMGVTRSANYTCVAASSLGVIQASTLVKVQALPGPPTSVRISEITATSVRLTWSYGGGGDSGDMGSSVVGAAEDLQYYVIQYKPKYANQAYSEISGVITMYYTVRGLSPYTEYEFFVIAVNGVGRGPASTPATVTTGETGAKPGTAPRNVQVRPLSSSTMVIQWDEPEMPNGQVTGYKVYYTVSPNLQMASWESQMVDNNQLTTISDLVPHTIYTIRVQAFTSVGPGPLSAPVQVKTQQGVPSQPSSLHATDIGETSVSLKWSKPSHSGENIVSYELYWNDTYAKEKHHRRIGITESYTLTGLYPNTLYFIWLAARSQRGEGATTPPIPVRTKQYVPGEPQDVTAVALNSTTIRVKWRPPQEKDRNGIIRGYHVHVQEMKEEGKSLLNEPMRFDVLDGATGGSDSGDGSAAGSGGTLDVGGLQPDTQYAVQVAALTRKGDGDRSAPVSVRTPGGVPNRPTLNVKILEREPSVSVELEWTRPTQTYGELLGYRLRYGVRDQPLRYIVAEGEGGSEGSGLLPVTPGAQTQRYRIPNLERGVDYEFRVSGENAVGRGQEAVTIVSTPEGAPSMPPSNITARFQTPDVASIRWDPPPRHACNGKLTFYGVQFHRHADHPGPDRNVTKVTKAVFTDLEENTEYVFRIRAFTNSGPGPYSERISLRTEREVVRAPMGVRAVATSDSSVEVWWESVPSRGKVLGYQVFYTMTAVEDLDEWQHKVVGLTESADLVNLEKFAQYAIAVAARTKTGLGRLSEKVTVKVKPEDVPLNLRAHDVSTHSMTLSWSPPIRLNPINFKISYEAVKEFVDSQGMTQTAVVPRRVVTLPPTTHSHTISELSPFTTYFVNVSAVPADRHYRPPAKITVTTQMAAPQPMVKPDFYGVVNGEEIQVILPQASEEYGPISHYFLAVVPDDESTMDKNPDQFLTSELVANSKARTERQGNVDQLLEMAPYIAAKFPQRNIPYTFHLGNSETYEGFTNWRLEAGRRYRIFVRAVVDTPQKHLYTSSPFSEYLALDMREVPPGDPPRRPDPNLPPPDGSSGSGSQSGGGSTSPGPSPGSGGGSSGDTGSRTQWGSKGPDVKADPNPEATEAGMVWVVGPVIAALLLAICLLLLFVVRRRRQPCKAPDQSAVTKPLMSSAVATDISSSGHQGSHISSSPRMNQHGVHSGGGGVGGHGQGSQLQTLLSSGGSGMGGQGRMGDGGALASDPVEMRRLHFQTPAMVSHPPVPIAQLAAHVERLKANDNLKFSQEYESIEPGQQFTWDHSSMEVNKSKNRYANVIAYDHSRVVLQPLEAGPGSGPGVGPNGFILGSDYINANYCDGYRKHNAYVATQGPLQETCGDFWRMCWEVSTCTIVMMTKLEERTRIKCDQYWPTSRGHPESYGPITVTLTDTQQLATYCIRTLLLQRSGHSERREVRQFQFTAWPDHGVPDHPAPFLLFLRRVHAMNPQDAGPMVVHCSAGVGRTGCFIVIDSMLERMKNEDTVDIYGHVTCLRAQRNYMVQTEDQYIFIHDALLEAVECGNTEVAARHLHSHIQRLMQPAHEEAGESITGMELEFKRLSNLRVDSPRCYLTANMQCNKGKNRLVHVLPYEATRVCLAPLPPHHTPPHSHHHHSHPHHQPPLHLSPPSSDGGDSSVSSSIGGSGEGSDYINASFIDGYRQRSAYIAAQGPLPNTVGDFWRMLWEHNATIVVMLTKLRELGREKCYQYWPGERSVRYGCFVVDPIAEYNMPTYILREFKVTDARDGQSRTVRQFQFIDWPEQGVPKSGEGFIDFIGQVHKTKEQFGQEGPITVHCSAGVGRTGVFITLSIVLERMQYEGVVDLFQTVRILRTQRPAMVQTEDQYQFCYRAALEYLGSFDHYAN